MDERGQWVVWEPAARAVDLTRPDRP
jgi:hypothetical protein